MPFEKGMSKPSGSGRQKGTANRRTVSEKLAALKCDPIEGMARIALDKDNKIELRARMFAELSRYCFPQLKSIEMSGPGGGPMEMNVSGIELLHSRISRIVERRRAGGST